MASPITHFVVGASLALPSTRLPRLRAVLPVAAIPAIAGVLAVIPDFDLLWYHRFPDSGTLGHRGFLHAPFTLIILATCLAIMVAGACRQAAGQLSLTWSLSAVTHPLLDMLTDGGTPVEALFPFSTQGLFFSWRPIRVSPLYAVRFFSGAGYILKSELPFCVAAVTIGISTFLLWRLCSD